MLGAGLSVRDLILIAGGLFLLFKATTELHGRLEGTEGSESGREGSHAAFWQIVAQIVILDFVFSIDSVVTAVGMVDQFSIMVIAVLIAILAMMVLSGPLTTLRELAPDDCHPGARFPADDRLQPVRRGLGIQDTQRVSLCRDRLLGHDRNAQPNCEPQSRQTGREPGICDRGQPKPFCACLAARVVTDR